jgi:ribonuclease P/MRP protein subunit POP1
VVCLDSSFVKAISISGSSAAISSLLAKLHLNASFHLIDFNLRKLHGVFLHKPAQNSTSKTSFIPMAPARIHGRKISDSKYQFLLWIDPHAIKEVETVLKELGGKDVCVELFGALQNRFEIIGPKASSVLQKILDPMDSNVKDALKKYLVNRPKTIPAGTTLAFEVRDPRMIRYARRLAPPQPTTNSKPSSQFPSLVDLMNSLVLHGSASTDGLASHSSLDSCPLFNSTNPRDFACKFHDHQTQDPQTMHSVSQESKAWILLQRFEDGGDEHEGWYLSVPATWGKVFWRCLVRPGGVRPIGLRERQDLDFESGRPRFPQDFPGCLSYTKYINELSENLKEAWLRRPPQKRLNYAKQGISSPFKVDLLALWQRCAGHYLPSEFIGPEPIIYLSYSFGNSSIPSKPVSELKPTWTKTSNNSYALRLPLVPVLITLDDGGTTMKYNAHIYEMDAKKTGSESIGFVTSGAFSYSRGKCTAIAFIATHLLHRSGQKILVRNVTSIEYHIASWEHIASIYG